tara:strand:- start:513 stop:773 length:261 start_codon:yes stop_codon:yes gene_type:complete
MAILETTSLSSRGQIVIPRGIRKKLSLHIGEKFVIVGEDDTILLKKMEMPSFKGFDNLLKRTTAFAKKKGIHPSDVKEAERIVRKK